MATTAVPVERPVVQRLERTWETPPGLRGVLSTVDHKTIGLRYLVTAIAFLALGGLEALAMRTQLAAPEQRLLSPQLYNQLFSMHGVTMIFLYAAPVLSGFSNYLWPLMLGSRDMAFPRLNALSYWIFLVGGIFLYVSLLVGQMPNDGWFNYVPFAAREYDPGRNIDFYLLAVLLLTISTTVGSANFIVTLFKTRAPGMSLNRVPIIVWGTLTASIANLVALPALSAACVLLFLDRHYGTHFYDAAHGGHPLLWQHLFWMFGHPWVYVVVLPAMGIVSDALPTFCRRPLVGYTFVALATVATGILGFGVWVHHMFATGLPPLSLAFFGGASILITVPSAVGVFAWLATIWDGRPRITTAFLFMAGFIVLFVIGGVSGVMTAAVPFDYQLTDTYFVVAHLHYVLVGINLFAVVAGLYYWFPKFTGRLMSERLGRWNFWTMFLGTNLVFFPMHIVGMLGMPRRIYTYPAGLGWGAINLIETVGAFLFALGFLLLVANVLVSRRRGEPAGANPWDAPTLEWATPSPPPPYNFAVLPTIGSRYPLWEERLGTEAGTARSLIDRGPVLVAGRETIGSSPLDAQPLTVMRMPSDSYWPLALALSLAALVSGFLVMTWPLAVAGLVAMGISIVGWLWPTRPPSDAAVDTPFGTLPVGLSGRHSVAFWGMVCLVVTEASFFAYLLFSYFYLASMATHPWPTGGPPDLRLVGANTVILLASSGVMLWAEAGARRGAAGRLVTGLAVTIGMGALFLVLQGIEYSHKAIRPQTDAYGSLFYTITGFHGAHVAVGLLMLAVVLVRALRGHFSAAHHTAVSTVALYWHFVDVVWLAVFTSLYVSPYLQ